MGGKGETYENAAVDARKGPMKSLAVLTRNLKKKTKCVNLFAMETKGWIHSFCYSITYIVATTRQMLRTRCASPMGVDYASPLVNSQQKTL